MKKIQAFLIFLTLIGSSLSCSQQKKIDIPQSPDRPLNVDQVRTFDANLLQGSWWDTQGTPNALFTIEGDTLYYTEDIQTLYFVKFKNDSLELSSGDLKTLLIVKRLNKDSLVFNDGNSDGPVILLKERR